jgi:hypothetical protein
LFFEEVGANLLVEEKPFPHTLPILDEQGQDGYGRGNYDGVGAILTHLLLNIPETGISEIKERELGDWLQYGQMREFAQMEFVDEDIY